MAITDEKGRFTFVAPQPPRAYFLYAGAAEFDALLQATFGRTVAISRRGEQSHGVVVPAIPSTVLTGSVRAEDGRPLAGCFVSAYMLRSDDLRLGSESWIEADVDRTAEDGSYRFTRLGADRYVFAARCEEPWATRTSSAYAWEPETYADVIALLPGAHREGVDFRLRRKRSYMIEGKVIFADGTAPKPLSEAGYLHNLQMRLSGDAFGEEVCDWSTNTGTFHCYPLRPGTYTLDFQIPFERLGAAFSVATQSAHVEYTVRSGKEQRQLTIHLREVAPQPIRNKALGPTGFLDLGKACGKMGADAAVVNFLAIGKHHTASGVCYPMIFFGDNRPVLPEDVYTVALFEAAFHYRGFVEERDYKLLSLLMRHGTPVAIRAGRVSRLNVPILSTRTIIESALRSIR